MSDSLVSQVWPFIDLDKWDRPGALVWLVGQLSAPPCPAPIDPVVIQVGLERSPEQAKYDHRVMIRLAERDRVLIRWPGRGRRPDAWLVNPDVTRWRNVPWVPTRATVMRLFLGPDSGNLVPLWGERAGQGIRMRGEGSSPEPIWAKKASNGTLSVRTSTAHDHPTTARPTLRADVRSPHNGTPSVSAFPFRSESEFTPSLPPSEGGRECVEQSQAEDAGAVLLAAVKSTVQTAVSGTNCDRIRAVGRARPDLLDDLLRFASTLTWVRKGTEAAKQIEEELERLIHAPAPPEPARPDPAARLATVRRLMAAYEPDDERLVELLAEAERLEAEVGHSAGCSI